MTACTRCGVENLADATFCASCGRFLDWSASSPAAEAPAAAPTRSGPAEQPAPAAAADLAPPAPSLPLSTPPPGSVAPTPPRAAPPRVAPVTPVTPVTPRAAPQRPAVARPEQQYRLVRKPTDPVAVEPIDAGRAAPWSTNGVGSSDAGHGLYLVVEAHELTAVPGAETSTAVRVRNTGSHVERAVVEVRGLPAGWVTVQPPELHLDVAAEGTAVVRFHPPRGPASGRGRMPLEFAVLSASNPTVRCIDGGTLTVEEFADVRAAVEPASVTSRGAATFAVTLENHGNRTVSRRVVATGGAQVRARVQPATVELAPGASVVLAVAATPRRLVSGAARTHTVTVGLDGADLVMAPVPLQLHQQPLLPPLVFKAVLVVLAGALVIGGASARSWWKSRPRPVPVVAGMTKDAASSALKRKGFAVQVEVAAGSDLPKDIVVRQSPLPGLLKRAKTTVVLGISGGSTSFSLLDAKGKVADDVRKVLEGQKLVVSIETRADSTLPSGTVIDQDPKPDAAVVAGTKVKLVVSAGKPTVSLPSLVGFPEDAALAKLNELKLVARIATTFDDANVGRVVAQSPGAGMVEEGSTVVLTMGRASAPKP